MQKEEQTPNYKTFVVSVQAHLPEVKVAAFLYFFKIKFKIDFNYQRRRSSKPPKHYKFCNRRDIYLRKDRHYLTTKV